MHLVDLLSGYGVGNVKEINLEKNRTKYSYWITNDGKIFRQSVGMLNEIAGGLNTGYKRCSLPTKKGEKHFYVHVLVAKHFVLNDDPILKTMVNHKDGNKVNNHYSNLEWVTPFENTKHAIEEGLIMGRTSVSPEDVHKVCAMYELGYMVTDIEKLTGIKRNTILSIRQGNVRKDIWSQYNIKRYEYNQLNTQIVHEICKRLEKGLSLKDIGDELNVNTTTINSIRRGDTWKEVSRQYKINKPKARKSPAVVNDELMENVFRLLNNGVDRISVAKELNINKNLVTQIKKRVEDDEKYNYLIKRYPNVQIRRKITEDVVRKICVLLDKGYGPKAISDEVGVSTSLVGGIKGGHTWKEVSKDYNFIKNKG